VVIRKAVIWIGRKRGKDTHGGDGHGAPHGAPAHG